jgi:predicted nucleotidyltransferase
MRRDEAIRRIREHEPELRAYGFTTLSLFGSVARGQESATSDIDILVDFPGRVGFRQFMGLKFALEDLLGCRVDLVDRQALRPGWRELIESELLLVA